MIFSRGGGGGGGGGERIFHKFLFLGRPFFSELS